MIDHVAVIAAEADTFADAVAAADPSATVPTCPDWTAKDLLAHLTQVHDFWAHVIGDRLDGPAVGRYEDERPPLPEEKDALLAKRREATAALVAALQGRDPAEHAWSWFPPDQTVGFTLRMQVHEATMHRVDAELAAGRPISPIDPEVAQDGIDHCIDVMNGWVPGDVERTDLGVVELDATDTGARTPLRVYRWSGEAWGQTFTDQVSYERAGGAEPTAQVSGTSQSLDLLLWTRIPLADVETTGDQLVLDAFASALDEGVA